MCLCHLITPANTAKLLSNNKGYNNITVTEIPS